MKNEQFVTLAEAVTPLSDIKLEIHPEDTEYPFWAVTIRHNEVYSIVSAPCARTAYRYFHQAVRLDRREAK